MFLSPRHLYVGMKAVRLFSDRIWDRIRLEGFRSVRIRVRIFNIWYCIRIRIFKLYIYDVDIQSYLIRHGWHYPYSNSNPTRNIKTNMISRIYVRMWSVFIPTYMHAAKQGWIIIPIEKTYPNKVHKYLWIDHNCRKLTKLVWHFSKFSMIFGQLLKFPTKRKRKNEFSYGKPGPRPAPAPPRWPKPHCPNAVSRPTRARPRKRPARPAAHQAPTRALCRMDPEEITNRFVQKNKTLPVRRICKTPL